MTNIRLTHNDWATWYYDCSGRLTSSYKAVNCKILSFREALKYNAIKTIEEYPRSVFDIMFSGGVDCEAVLRTYLNLGQAVTVNVFRYENNYNQYDVDYAIRIAKSLGVSIRIIDFNLSRFFQNEAADFALETKCFHARALPQIKFMDYVDNVPVYAASDLSCHRLSNDYSVKQKWVVREYEFELAWGRYAAEIGRPAIGQWFVFTPEMIVGTMQTKNFSNLVNDRIYGKLGIHSTKLEKYREAYPDMEDRVKQTGFELADNLARPFQESLNTNFDVPGATFCYPGTQYTQYIETPLDDVYNMLVGKNFYD